MKITICELGGEKTATCPNCGNQFYITVPFSFSAVCRCGIMLEIKQDSEIPIAGIKFNNKPFMA